MGRIHGWTGDTGRRMRGMRNNNKTLRGRRLKQQPVRKGRRSWLRRRVHPSVATRESVPSKGRKVKQLSESYLSKTKGNL